MLFLSLEQKESIARRNYRSARAVTSSEREVRVFFLAEEREREKGGKRNNEAGREAVIDCPPVCSLGPVSCLFYMCR